MPHQGPDAAERLFEMAETAVAERAQRRVVEHLVASLEYDLRRGATARLPTNQEALVAILKETARALGRAGQIMKAAAERFNQQGDKRGAAKTMEAAKEALDQAAAVLGE